MIRLYVDGELIGEFADSKKMEKHIKDNKITFDGKRVRFDCE
jgi:hypothetical protein